MELSTGWLGHFQYGLVEWVWHQLTYRQRLPLRIRRWQVSDRGKDFLCITTSD
ncbi:MAG TPA: hypothetical protein VFD58_11780 [Blastocatellia bacterium]|nr:hypothetical protein [Blastocatellia bacterium]